MQPCALLGARFNWLQCPAQSRGCTCVLQLMVQGMHYLSLRKPESEHHNAMLGQAKF